MKIFTIGFTKKSAQKFFDLIKEAKVKRIVDVRLNNVSQLSGFAKRDDLKFFLKEIKGANIGYEHLPDLAPTKEILNRYRQDKNWQKYVKDFLALMEERRIEKIDKEVIADGCLLCSEDKPHQCHRTLVAKYLQGRWKNVKIHDLF